jgi:hypothetical protein
MFGSRFIPSLESLDERANPGGGWGSVGGADPFLVGGPGNVPEDDEGSRLGAWVVPIGDPGGDGNDAGGGRGGIGGEV